MATERKIYKVIFGGTPAIPKTTVLVKASNGARAERHIAHDVLKIEAVYATQSDLIDALSAGAKVEDAKED